MSMQDDDLPAEPAAVPPDSLTTHDAAQLLGVSPGTVLNMIERGQLDAWRTAGGHRRIARASLQAYLDRQQPPRRAAPDGTRRLRVMIIEDEAFQRTLYRDQIEHWALPIELTLCATGLEGILEIGRHPPDVLFVDLRMPEIDGFAVIRHLRENTRFAHMDIVVITGLDEAQIDEAGGLPDDVTTWHKPIPFPRMRGYIEARLSSVRRSQTS